MKISNQAASVSRQMPLVSGFAFGQNKANEIQNSRERIACGFLFFLF
jgi:hypothetical protein